MVVGVEGKIFKTCLDEKLFILEVTLTLLQIAPSHSSVRYNTDLPPLSHSKLILQVLSMVLYC